MSLNKHRLLLEGNYLAIQFISFIFHLINLTYHISVLKSMLRLIFTCSILLFTIINCSNKVDSTKSNIHSPSKTIIKGISLVAPPSPFDSNPMTDVKKVNADWIAIIPYAGYQLGSEKIRFNMNGQWWGESPEGIKETIRLAKEAGLKVLLKPQIWVPGSWAGGIDFETEKEWQVWEESYTEYINLYIELTKDMDVDMICIGTEIKASEIKREKFWRTLIKDIKKEYKGKLTYAANWDCYHLVPFWDDLDFIGVDAYFPLDESKTPSKKALLQKWKPVHQQLSKVSKKFKTPILFTEFGYLSVDGCAGKTWELEKKTGSLPTNEKAQSIALDALFEFFSKQDYWEGGFLWKWYPELGIYQDHGDNGHTPQGKIAEETLKEWYSKM